MRSSRPHLFVALNVRIVIRRDVERISRNEDLTVTVLHLDHQLA